jgi:hypothetical protein
LINVTRPTVNGQQSTINGQRANKPWLPVGWSEVKLFPC